MFGFGFNSYDFLCVTRSLDAEAIKHLRSVARGAEVSFTSMSYIYDRGPSPFDPVELLIQYFDIYLHVSDFGLPMLGLSFDEDDIDLDNLKPLLTQAASLVHVRSGRCVILLEMYMPFSAMGGGLEDVQALYREILKGDYRAFYIAMLRSIDPEEDELSSPHASFVVPQGLKSLTMAQKNFAQCIGLDYDLFEVVSQLSPDFTSNESVRAWFQQKPREFLEDLLVTLFKSADAQVYLSTLEQLVEEASVKDVSLTSMTMQELKDAALAVEEERNHQQNLEMQEQRLQQMEGHEEDAWDLVDDMISQKKSESYEVAAELLLDLKVLAERQDDLESFHIGLHEIHQEHHRKRKLLKILSEHGLDDPGDV